LRIDGVLTWFNLHVLNVTTATTGCKIICYDKGMRKIIIQEFITLDGVMQAPGGSDEDIEEGFKYGGWTAPYFRAADAEAEKFMAQVMASSDLLLGRKTFDLFADYWPKHADMWPGIMDVTKYCVSSNKTKSAWNNSKFLKNLEDIKKLKATDGGELKVIGSGNLVQTLLKHDLVDEMLLMIFPITLGTGKRLFAEGTTAAAFEITDSLVTKNGVIFATYKRAGEVKTGTVGA
jgi:dihydrofolate reductase